MSGSALLCGHCGALLDLPPLRDERYQLFDHWLDEHRGALLDHSLTTGVYRVAV